MLKRLLGLGVVVGLLFTVAPSAHASTDVVAHQGYGGSYTTAARQGATLEGDMQLTEDNKVVIYHNARLSRVCFGKSLIKTLTWRQIHACDAKVIQLGTLLNIAKSNGVKVSLEFKSNGGKKWTKSRMRIVKRELSKYSMLNHRTEMYSFSYSLMKRWRSVTKRTLSGLNVNKASKLSPTKIKRAGGRVAVSDAIVNREKVQWLRGKGIYVSIYTARTQAQLQRMKAMGPNEIITDIHF